MGIKGLVPILQLGNRGTDRHSGMPTESRQDPQVKTCLSNLQCLILPGQKKLLQRAVTAHAVVALSGTSRREKG